MVVESWCVYLLRTTSARKYYVGCTKDPLRRFLQHLVEQGARFTRGHRPFESRILGVYASKNEALEAERQWCDRLSKEHPDMSFNMGGPDPDLRGSYDGHILPPREAAKRVVRALQRE
jgi:predicted GIY-YIG superfamily endonuclease